MAAQFIAVISISFFSTFVSHINICISVDDCIIAVKLTFLILIHSFLSVRTCSLFFVFSSLSSLLFFLILLFVIFNFDASEHRLVFFSSSRDKRRVRARAAHSSLASFVFLTLQLIAVFIVCASERTTASLTLCVCLLSIVI